MTPDQIIRHLQNPYSRNDKDVREAMLSAAALLNSMLFLNQKNGDHYCVLGEVINATNAQDGQRMVLYRREQGWYVREVGEFEEKFFGA